MPRHKRQARRNEESEEEERRERSRSREKERVFQEEADDDGNQQNHEQDGGQSSVEEQQHSQNEVSGGEQQGKAESVAVELRECFLEFFGRTKNEKGFVFTPQQRSKLQKEQSKQLKNNRDHVVIEWKNECEWIQQEERAKIEALFLSQNLQISREQLQIIKDVFLNTSYLFGNQTTGELYAILLAILKIVLAYPPQSIELYRRLSQLMNEVRNDTVHYRFFNYTFSSYYTLPQQGIDDIYNSLAMDIATHLQTALTE